MATKHSQATALRRPRVALSIVSTVAVLVLAGCDGGGRAADEAAQAGTRAAAAFAPQRSAQCGAENNREAFAAGPDRVIGLSEVLRRGGLRLLSESQGPTRAHSASDGRVDDWRGTAPRLGGLAVYDQGEHIYSDYLYDAWGADDGADVQRYGINEGLQQLHSRVERVDQLFQALGDQFGVPGPVGASSHYGDATDIRGPHDLTELRWAASAQGLQFYARYSRLTEDDQPALAVLFDLDAGLRADIPQLGLSDTRFDHLLLLSRQGPQLTALGSGASITLDAARWQWLDHDFVNAVELELPWAALGGPRDELWLSAMSLQAADSDGDGQLDQFTPANLAYRYDALDDGQLVLPCDPVAGMYNDRAQAFDLYNGNIDGYAIALDIAGMRAGRTQRTQPSGGYYERHFKSDPETSHEDPVPLGYEDASDPFEPFEQTVDQAYGLFLPYDYDPARRYPLTLWLHYQGGMTHSAGAWSPRIVHQHGQDHQNIVATPRARGSKSWYVGVSHQDVWEVFADVAGTAITGEEALPSGHGFGTEGLALVDASRVYLSGYSMGGYGTYMFGLMYPDKFAAAYSTSGVHFGDALPGGMHLIDNARHLPIVIHHGSFDELVPWVSIFPVATTLQELGYRHRMDTFPGYEHYTQAIVDEWAEGTAYLNRFSRPEQPRRITYKLVPEMQRLINHNRSTLYGAGRKTQFDFRPDGAWWLDDIRVRDDGGCDLGSTVACDDSVFGQVEATSLALPDELHTTLPALIDADNGLGLPSTPVASPGNQSTPYLRTGLDWVPAGAEPQLNGFVLELQNIAALSLDALVMQLDASDEIGALVETDGEVQLRLDGLPRQVRAEFAGSGSSRREAGALMISLPAGVHEFRLVPR